MSKRRLATALLTALLLAPAALVAESHETEGSMTEEEKVLYALGLVVSRNLTPFDLSAEELATLQAGLSDGVLGKDTHGIDPMAYQGKFQQLAQERSQRVAEREKAASREFLATAAAEPAAVTTDSGLIYTVIEEGEGDSPQPGDRVKVHYHGTLRDGTVFDSSVARGEPASFQLDQVIPCWTEGVAMMKVGGKSKLVCPSDIAYGDGGRGPLIKGGAALVFEVELLEILDP